MRLNGAKIILECLIRQGIDTVFGYPGGNILELYDALYEYQDKIRHIITSHEQGACHAADGYSRVSGKTGVVIATSGPGATNLVTGIAAAYMDSVPLVAITGNVALPFLGRDSFQEIDITGITVPITKQSYIVKDVSQLTDIVCEAFRIANSGRKGPVLIDVPKNILSDFAEFEYPDIPPLPKRSADERKLAAAAEMIAASKKPLLFIGGGVISANAIKEVGTLSEKLDIPICSSLMGIGFDAESPKWLGFAGMHGLMQANLAVKNCDLLIGVGVRFSDRVATDRKTFAQNAKIIHIDIDNAEIDKNIPTDCHILGNCREILKQLTDSMESVTHPDWMEQISGFKQRQLSLNLQKHELNPKNILTALAKSTPNTQVIVTDVGQHQMWTAQHYPFKLPRTFITSGGLGAMGFGMGAAIGACAYTGKKTVLITGDGSFHMNLNELATAVRNQLPIVVVVMNNHVLGMVRQLQKVFFQGRFSQTGINNPTDYVALARAFGGDGCKITKDCEIQSAIDAALKSDKPFVIDADMSMDENVLPMIPTGKSVDDVITEIR